nr:hypothetical protein [Tanacetum cinerariifolium]
RRCDGRRMGVVMVRGVGGVSGGSEWVGDGGVAVAGWLEVWPDPMTAPEKLESV